MNEKYKDLLYDIKTDLSKTTKSTEYIDTSKMLKKEKEKLIKKLPNQIHKLQRKLLIRKSIDNRYIHGLLQSKFDEIIKLIDNPVLTLSSGKQIIFNSLSPEQLKYLEGLSLKNNKFH